MLKTFLYSLMRYNILDTTSSSATEARKIFKENWNDIINTIEGFLTSASTSPSLSTPVLADQDTEHDGQAEEIKQYLNDISKNVVSKHCFQRNTLIFVISNVYFIRIPQKNCAALSRQIY
jgi:hypothetical protein